MFSDNFTIINTAVIILVMLIFIYLAIFGIKWNEIIGHQAPATSKNIFAVNLIIGLLFLGLAILLIIRPQTFIEVDDFLKKIGHYQ